ncbi:MAG TPA: alpha/beta hydrolase [Candidatus Acidoferrales bacterium]|nr:alpha/beta hydrolase [Candidatus Acidoferrales bacterium]
MKPRVLLLSLLLTAFATGSAHADGPVLQTLEIGNGPVVVLVPGLGFSRTDWLPTVKRLREHYRCVMVEIPGQGTSPLPDPFSLQAAAEALDAVLARQNADSTIVVGSGVGGLLSLLSASAHPTHVRGVMLIDTPIKSPIPVTDQQRDMVLKAMDENFNQFLQLAYGHAGRDSVESAQIFAMVSSEPPATMRAYLGQLLAVDANREVRSLRVPLALAISDRNWKPGACWGSVARSMGYEDSTSVRPERIAGAGALAMKEQPDSVATLIAAFAEKELGERK